MATVSLLGPQRTGPIVRATIESLGIDGPVALVTAGWEEREGEHEELARHLQLPSLNLMLYRRTDEVYAHDRELWQAMRNRHDALRTVQDLYRLRLDHALEAARALVARDDDPALLVPEVEEALAAITTLDRQHLERVRAVHAEFEARLRPGERDAVQRARRAVQADLDECVALAVAGGHVAVLVNRMRLLGLAEAIGERPVIAWSAGAMAVTDRIVLFHDSPPEGRGNSEVLVHGLGLVPAVVALPHARRRLLLNDQVRVGILARRLHPSLAVALDEGSRLDWDGQRLVLHPGTRWLDGDGNLHDGARP